MRFADVSYFLNFVFNDFRQTNFLDIYRTDLHQIFLGLVELWL